MDYFNLKKYRLVETEDVFTIKNNNTTIAFLRYNQKGEVEYIFVNPIFRKKGLAKKLLKITEEKLGTKLIPQEPISPLGRKLFHLN